MAESIDLVTQYRGLARYNTWMNASIYAACEKIRDDERKRDRGAFFGSIHRTLNHLLLTDHLQLARFIGADRTRLVDSSGKQIVIRSLDQELYADFNELRAQRIRSDALIEKFTVELNSDVVASDLVYDAMSAPGRYRVPMWVAITHYFNHQAHHRGQVTTMLSQCGIDVGVTDFLALNREKIG